MTFVALAVAGAFLVYSGFFYLVALALQMGVPLDAVRAGLHRTWLGAAATLATLVIHIFLRLADVSPETLRTTGLVAAWVLRAALWIWVTTWVYRVTRWRKGKLAVVVALGLALNLGVDLGLARLGPDRMPVPAFGSWEFRLS